MGKISVFVSSFTVGRSAAIHHLHFDTEFGSLTKVSRKTDIRYPFYLALSQNKSVIYAVNAPDEFRGKSDCEVVAYRIDYNSGELQILNKHTTCGTGTCYIDAIASNKALLIANYWSGSVTSLMVDQDGALRRVVSFFRHDDFNDAAAGGKRSRVHCIVASPDGRYALAPDLGTGRIEVYRFNAHSGELSRSHFVSSREQDSASPRHLVFHTVLPIAFVTNERDSTVAVFEWASQSGQLSLRQVLSTLPEGYAGENNVADLKIRPDGKYLYVSNRGHDSIAVFGIREDGKITKVEIESSAGASPHSIAITACGTYMFCANLAGECLACFQIDRSTGKMQLIGEPVHVASPACVAI